jgi:Heat shock transcription factor
MDILNNDEYQGIIQWLPQGDGFIIHDKQRCADEVLPHHFGSVSKYASFTRRLNRWNFIFQQKGNKKALYFHPLFVRSNPSLCLNMRPRRQKNYNQKYRDNKRHHLLLQEVQEQQQALSIIHNNSMMSSFHRFDGNRVLTHCPSFTAAGGHPYLVQEQATKSSFEAHPHLNESSMSFALHVPPQQQLLQNQSVYNDENLYNPYLHPPSYGQTNLPDYNAVMHKVSTGQSPFHRGVMMGNNNHQFNKASTYAAHHHPVPRSSVLVGHHTSPPPVVMGQAMTGPLQYFVPSSAAGSSTSDQHMQFVRDRSHTGNNNSYSSQPMMFHMNQKSSG